MRSNDKMRLVPRTDFEGERGLHFGFDGLRVGVAEYEEGPTGCTVFHFTRPTFVVADVRGGSSVTTYTQQLANGVLGVDAICWAGGSTYGLEAVAGVGAEIMATRGYSSSWDSLALVSGGILFDYGARDNSIYPDKALGRAALRDAVPGFFPLGSRGAGRSASCGWFGHEPAGHGGAFREIGPTKVAVFTVVNAVGVIVDRQGRVVRGNLDSETGQRGHSVEHIERRLAGAEEEREPRQANTTLTLVLTNQKLGGAYASQGDVLSQLARQVHTSMARAIHPFHSPFDGDTLWAGTTSEVENPQISGADLALLASELAWDAVLSCCAPPAQI
jgi:6-aminohexanoate-oligomer endohydrolase